MNTENGDQATGDARHAVADPQLTLECDTCVATGTTACAECVVTHLLANDDGPIEYVPVPVGVPRSPAQRAVDRAIAMFVAAGLVDDPVQFVTPADFEHGRLEAQLVAAPR